VYMLLDRIDEYIDVINLEEEIVSERDNMRELLDKLPNMDKSERKKLLLKLKGQTLEELKKLIEGGLL